MQDGCGVIRFAPRDHVRPRRKGPRRGRKYIASRVYQECLKASHRHAKLDLRARTRGAVDAGRAAKLPVAQLDAQAAPDTAFGHRSFLVSAKGVVPHGNVH